MGIREFRVVASAADETADPALSPAELVETLSRRKALTVQAQERPDAIVLAADTVVTLDGAVLGKPADEAAALADALRPLGPSPSGIYRSHRPAGTGGLYGA